jgi:hypothetical protein
MPNENDSETPTDQSAQHQKSKETWGKKHKKHGRNMGRNMGTEETWGRNMGRNMEETWRNMGTDGTYPSF